MLAPLAMNAQSGNWSNADYRDTQWGTDYASASSFTITTPEQLAQFAYMVNNGSDFGGKTVTLDDGIEEVEWNRQVYSNPIYFDGDLRSHYWTPIGTADHPFNGTFNGNSKDVICIRINDDAATYQGLFGYIGTGGTVISTTVRMSTITAASQVGAIAGYNSGTMTNCVVTDNTITGTSYTGAIVGQNAGTMTTCYAIFAGSTKAIGTNGSATSEDIEGQGQCLWRITGNDIEASVGTPTGTIVGSAKFYDDGIQYNYYHYYKTGATATVTYTQSGYNVTFSVSGAGASIDGNVVTVGTEDVTVTIESTSVADWDGTGTESDPYLIYNPEQLDLLATRVNDGTSTYDGNFFRLENDIDDVYTYVAIGTSGHPFSGTFDGNGHSIDRPQIQLANTSYQGVFGYSNGTIKNLKVTDPYILGGDYTGGIVGYNAGAIENCRVDDKGGVLYGENGHHSYGGIAGYNSGTISHCVSATSVDCYSYNAPYSITKASGIVGHNAAGGIVEYSLYLGRFVAGTEYVGAIVGKNEGTLSANLYHHNGYQTYSSDNIGTAVLGVGVSDIATGADATGAAKAKVVKLPEGGTFSQPYGATVSGTPTYVTTDSPNGMPLSVYSDGILFSDTYFASSNELKTAFYTTAATVELEAIYVPSDYAATFSTTSEGASFNGNTLTVGTDVTEVSVSATRVPTGWLAEGTRASEFSTTGENSITIMNAAELGLLAYNVNFASETYSGYTITLGADIDLSGNTWEPIGFVGSGGGDDPYVPVGGGYGGASGFAGIFDGDNHIISNLNSGTCGTGLFSSVNSTVQNVTIQNATVSGTSMVGILAGMCSGTIQNCRIVDGNISFATNDMGYYMYLGGLVGICSGGTITGCSVAGTTIDVSVSGEMKRGIGGIVGMLSSSEYGYSGATLTNNIFSGIISLGTGAMNYGAIAGVAQDYSEYGEEPNTIANNYYTTGTIGGINNADVTENDGAVFGVIREIAGYGIDTTNFSHWAFIASPVVGSIEPTAVGNIFPSAGATSTEYDLYRFDQNADKEWVNYHSHTNDFNLINGQGYLYATKEDVTLIFTGEFNTGTEPVQVPLTYNGTAQFAGWNLVGNPFIRDAYITQGYFVIDENGGRTVVARQGGAIPPCTGVMVQASEGQTSITFSTTSPSGSKGGVEMTLAQNIINRNGVSTLLDNAIVSFNEGNELPKFYFGNQNANLYIPQGEKEYAIAFSKGQGEMPLNFRANENGSYTISVNPEGVELAYLHLIDNMTGEDVDLLASTSTSSVATYTFTAKTTDYESRFKLVFASSICGDANGDNATFAFFSNGN